MVAGTGAATKLQIQFMVTRLLRLKSAPQPSDAADGVAAALAYALMPELPKIEAVRFPAAVVAERPRRLVVPPAPVDVRRSES